MRRVAHSNNTNTILQHSTATKNGVAYSYNLISRQIPVAVEVGDFDDQQMRQMDVSFVMFVILRPIEGVF